MKGPRPEMVNQLTTQAMAGMMQVEGFSVDELLSAGFTLLNMMLQETRRRNPTDRTGFEATVTEQLLKMMQDLKVS